MWQHCAAILHVGLYGHCYGLGFSANANEVCNKINRLEVLSAAFLNVIMSRTFVAQRGTMMKNRRVSGVRSVLVELVSSVPSNTLGIHAIKDYELMLYGRVSQVLAPKAVHLG